jgi:hypothetical protein
LTASLAGLSNNPSQLASALIDDTNFLNQIAESLSTKDALAKSVGDELAINTLMIDSINDYISKNSDFVDNIALKLTTNTNYIAKLKGRDGGVSATAVENAVKDKTMWCADGSFCKVPANKYVSDFTMMNEWTNSNVGNINRWNFSVPENTSADNPNQLIITAFDGSKDSNNNYKGFVTSGALKISYTGGNILISRAGLSKPSITIDKDGIVNIEALRVNGDANILGNVIVDGSKGVRTNKLRLRDIDSNWSIHNSFNTELHSQNGYINTVYHSTNDEFNDGIYTLARANYGVIDNTFVIDNLKVTNANKSNVVTTAARYKFAPASGGLVDFSIAGNIIRNNPNVTGNYGLATIQYAEG